MSQLGGFSLGMPGFSSGASLQDTGAISTPVNVITGNGNTDIASILDGVAKITGSQAASLAGGAIGPGGLTGSATGGASGGGSNWILWGALALAAYLLFFKGK